MSVTTASNVLPSHPCKHHRLGEIEDGAIDLGGAIVRLGHDRRQLTEDRLKPGVDFAAVGDRQRGLDDIAVRQSPQRRSRMGVGRGHRRMPRHHAVPYGA